MSKLRRHRLLVGAADLAFSLGTFFVLWVILGIPAKALVPEVEPVVGTFLANAWAPGLSLLYCVWQFRKQRRLRREKAEAKCPEMSGSLGKDLDAEVAKTFGDQADDARTLLLSYDGKEADRVRRAIVVLSEGQLDRLAHFAERAIQDYRDVLYWAESPED